MSKLNLLKRKFQTLLAMCATAGLLATLLTLAQPRTVSAHPLGNFSINTYSRIELSPDQIRVRYVLNMAEIPTFEEMYLIDQDGDGQVSDSERTRYLEKKVEELRRGLHLTLDGSEVELKALSQELTFPPGQANLPTLRLVCDLEATMPEWIGSGMYRADFRDDNYPDRLGWREVVVRPANAVSIDESSVPQTDRSNELQNYPQDMLSRPLDQRQVKFAFAVGVPLRDVATPEPVGTSPDVRQTQDGFAALIAARELSLPFMLFALLAAMFWGAMHALSPGHGKTIVAAYLVGARGTVRHALFLGLTVTVTHTAGVFALGLVTLYTSRFILPERLYPWLNLASGLIVVGMGLGLFVTRVRQIVRHGRHRHATDEHSSDHHHDHVHEHGHTHVREHSHGKPGHEHDHSAHHGHSHLPSGADGSPVTWRGLLALGVSGGLLPCPSALVVLLSAIALGRVSFGLLLIVAFSMGLAGVLTGIGLLFLHAGRLFERRRLPRLPALARALPVASALAIALAGFGITAQAIGMADFRIVGQAIAAPESGIANQAIATSESEVADQAIVADDEFRLVNQLSATTNNLPPPPVTPVSTPPAWFPDAAILSAERTPLSFVGQAPESWGEDALIKVLQIYPDGHNTWAVAQAVYTWSDLFHIDVLPVSVFNTKTSVNDVVTVVDPISGQTASHPISYYDVLYFGIADQYAGRDLSPQSVQIARQFAQLGKGFLLSHDTVSMIECPNGPVCHPNFDMLRDVTGLTGDLRQNVVFFTRSKLVASDTSNPVLHVPFELPAWFPTLTTHWYGQNIRQGDRWYDGTDASLVDNYGLYMQTYYNPTYRSFSAFFSYGHTESVPLEWEAKAMINAMYYAYRGGGFQPASIRAEPASVPANGTSTSTVTLILRDSAGRPISNQQVRFVSTLPGVVFSPKSGRTDANGVFSAQASSINPGTAIISADNLTAGQSIPASASVTFTPVGGEPPPPPANEGEIAIAGIRAQHPLEARYLQGISVPNRVDVSVDWKGTTPGRVNFILNGQVHTQTASVSGASYSFDMGNDLRPGSNTLRIIAYNAAGKPSAPRDFAPILISAPVWLTALQQAGLLSLPVLASGDVSGKASYEMGFHFPAYRFSIDAPGFGVPDGMTGLEWNFEGKLKIPLDCSSALEGRLSLGADNAFRLLGGKIDVSGEAGLRADRVEVCAFELPHGFTKVKVEGTRTVYRKPVLVMIAYFNTAVGVAVDNIIIILHIEDIVAKVLGEIYVDGKAHFAVESDIAILNESPHWRLENLSFAGGAGVEGGYREEFIIEVKVYAGADGTIKFARMGPVTWPPTDNWHFDEIRLRGEVGAKFRAGWFEREAKGAIEWTYPPTAQAAMALPELVVSPWRLLGHGYREPYAVFHKPLPGKLTPFSRQALGLTPSSLATIAAEVLVSNVYTYTEPSLSVDPTTDEALLLWVHDVVTKPVGQSQEIYFSHWDGSTWSTPAHVTDDNLLDGAPQVAWAGDGNGVAVWQRLTDTLPITATWDVTTANKIEIATSVYSPTTGTWSPTLLLTANAALDFGPRVARNGSGQLLAVWRQNPAGLLSGDEANPDRIMASFYDGGWITPTTAVDDIPGLVDLAAGYGSGVATIAYTRYLTPTGYPTPTLQLFTSAWDDTTWSGPVQRTDDSLGHRNPQVVYNTANQPLVVWLAGNELRLQNLTTSSVVTLILPAEIGSIDEFRIVQDEAGNIAAFFTAQGAQRDLYVSFYDQAHNLWGNPTRLTNDRASEAYPTAGIDSSGRLLAAYAATAITSITQTTTISETGEVITYTLPVEGQTDLLTLSHVFTRNLTLTNADLALSNDHPAPGESVVISATVLNSGDLPLDDVAVGFYDGNPAAGGTLIRTTTLSAPLAAGFTGTLTTTYTVPTTGGARVLFAVADPANAIAEANEADNTASLAAFGPDLELSSAGVDFWGGSDVGLRTLIYNIGTTQAPTTTLAFYREAVTGTLAITDTIPALTAGQVITLTTPWNYGALTEGTYPLVTVVNQADFTETFRANNVYTFTLDVRPDLMVSPLYFWVTQTVGNQLVITGTVFNDGSVSAHNVQATVYAGSPFTVTSQALFTRTLSTLLPTSYEIITGTWTLGPSGWQELYLWVDPTNAITETTEANNLASTLNPPPQLDAIEHSPAPNPDSNDIVTIRAQVSDEVGISGVILKWWKDGTPQLDLTMYDDGAHDDYGANDGWYGVQIGPFPVGTIIEYQVEITDIGGVTVVAPQEPLRFESLEPFVKTAEVLFVPDNGGDDTDWFRNYYEDALTEPGYEYDVWDTSIRGEIDLPTLNQYTNGAVIWAVPSAGFVTNSDSTRNTLQSFLDNGGNLFITGQDIGAYVGGTSFYQDYLHASFVQNDVGLTSLTGVPGDLIGGGLSFSILGGDGANNQYQPDEIDPLSPAVAVFTYDTTVATTRAARVKPEATGAEGAGAEPSPIPTPWAGPANGFKQPTEAGTGASPTGIISSGTAALRVDTGIYRVVYFAFGFEGTSSQAHRQTIMGRVLNWLGAVPSVGSRDLAIQKSLGSSTPEPGGTLTYWLAYASLGNLSARNVRITDTLPAGTVYLSSTGPVTPSVTGQIVTWDLGTLPGWFDPNASGQISITVRIPVTMPVGTWLENQAQISTSDVETDTIGSGLTGSYYQYDADAIGIPPNDPFTNGVLKLRRTDPTVDFFWDLASPQPGVIYPEWFAARWTGYVYAPRDGTYTFATVTDDGTRLWVDGTQLINDWTQHPMEIRSGQIELVGGHWYAIQFDFEEGGGGAGARLQWQLPGDSELTTIPQRYLSPEPGFVNNRSSLGLLVMPPVKTSDLLLVLDYGGNNTDWFRPYFTDALNDLGYACDVWDTEFQGPVQASILDQFVDGAVIWAVPYWGYVTHNGDQQAALQAYLDAGGKLFITGQDLAAHLNGRALLSDYLHASYVQDDVNFYALNGASGDPIGDEMRLSISGGDGANNQGAPDEIDPISPAVTVFTYDTTAASMLESVRPKASRPGWGGGEPGAVSTPAPWSEAGKPLEKLVEAEPAASPAGVISSGTGGLRVDTGTYRLAYFAFGFEGINRRAERAAVMERVLAWLHGVSPRPSQLSPASGSAVPVGDVTFTWSSVVGASGYQIQIDTTTAFTSPALISDTVSTTGYTATLTLGTWHWRVRALPDGAWTAPWEVGVAGPLVQVTTDPDWDYLPSIAQAADGTLWVAWTSERSGNDDIWYKTSTDGGTTWSAATQLTTDPDWDYLPSIAQAADGTLWVAWTSERSGNDDIWHKTSTDGGATWSAATQLTTDPNWDYAPDIAQAADGTLWVVWYSYRSGNADIWYKTSSDGGATWSAATQLTTDPNGDYAPDIAQAADGTLWVVWNSYRSGNYDLWYKTSTDGGTTWSAATQLTTYGGSDYWPSIAEAADGTLWLVWYRYINYGTQLWYKTSSDGGVTWSDDRQWTRFMGYDGYPDLAALSDGSVAVAWDSDRAVNYDVWFGIFGQREDVNPPPHVGDAYHLPGPNPDSDDTVTVRAYVADETAVSSTSLIWSRDGTPQADLAMYDDGAHDDYGAGDGWYGVQIGPFSVGTQIAYQVRAVDSDANTVTWSMTTKSFTILQPFSKTADILFVPDEGPYNDTSWFQGYYIEALESAGYRFDLWDVAQRGAPDSSILNQYTDGVVVWATPHSSGCLYSWYDYCDRDTTLSTLQAYLDSGGHLFISGQDIGERLGWHSFYQNYLHASLAQGNVGLYDLTGVVGDPIGDGLVLGIAGGDGANDQYSPDEINPISPAVTVFTYTAGATSAVQTSARPQPATDLKPEIQQPWDPEMPPHLLPDEGRGQEAEHVLRGGWQDSRQPSSAATLGPASSGTAGLRVDTGTYKVVYLAFGFEAVNNGHDRQLLMARIMHWFGLGQRCGAYDPDGSGDTTIADVQRLAQRWRDPAEYEARYDLNLDRVINVLDVMRMAVRWGTTCPSPNYALLFDGMDDFVSVADTGDFDFDNAFTLEAWVKPLAPADSETFKALLQGAFSEPPFTGSGWVMFLIPPSYSEWGLSVCTPGCEAAFSESGNLRSGQWQHLASTYDGTNIRIYRNGVMVATTPHSGNVTDINFALIGILETSFNGLIDEVRIWNITRTQSEIQADMNRTLSGDEPGLVGYWRFDEGGGQVAFDSTANHNDARLGSSPTDDSNDPIWLKRLEGP